MKQALSVVNKTRVPIYFFVSPLADRRAYHSCQQVQEALRCRPASGGRHVGA